MFPAEHTDPRQRHYLNLYKLGEGRSSHAVAPLPLPGANTVARVVLFGDAAGVPLGGPMVEVCATAKRDLRTGELTTTGTT